MRLVPLEERIWKFFDIGTTEECWEWKGRRRSGQNQYGIVSDKNRKRTASRVVYEVTHNIEPGDLQVLHHCDNPPCVNPNHLYLGTVADNTRDAIERGRHPNAYMSRQGELNGYAKLTAAEVQEIRHLYMRGGVTQQKIAHQFNICQSHVSAIIRGVWWKE